MFSLPCLTGNHYYVFFFKISFILFFGEGKGERKRGREASMCGCLLCAPSWGLGLQPRHVPWLEIEPVTLWFTGWHSTTEPHQPGLMYYFCSVCFTTNHNNFSFNTVKVDFFYIYLQYLILFYYLKIFFIDFRERKGDRERNSDCCSTYLCIHWLIFTYALTGDQTHNLGILGQCSNQLSYQARVCDTFWTLDYSARGSEISMYFTS